MSCIIPSAPGPEPPLLISKGFAVLVVTFARSGDTAEVTGSTFVRLEGAQVTGIVLYCSYVIRRIHLMTWLFRVQSQHLKK